MTSGEDLNARPAGQGLWPFGRFPRLGDPLPERMLALALHRDRYGPPREALSTESLPRPVLTEMDAGRVLVSVLATGPNFNTNFAALGLPVPVFGRGDGATVHIPGSDALGVVVDAGPTVTRVGVGQAVVLDSWTGSNIRGYETHDGFNAQFAMVDEARAIPVPADLAGQSPERLAALLLTYGTAYRAVVERLAVKPGESLLVMGGGKGTSFAGAQLGKALGARVILVGSNRELAESLIARGIADAFVNRLEIPGSAYGEVGHGESREDWERRSLPFREAVFAANYGRPVDAVFEHTGGANFPLLVSALADGGRLAFFGATGAGLRGEYRETFFAGQQRFVMDARWVWMRQKQILLRDAEPDAMLDEIRLPPGRRGLIWGADSYAQSFASAALRRSADLAVLASFSAESDGIRTLQGIGIDESSFIDLDQFELLDDMPDPLGPAGAPNDAYHQSFMLPARSLGRAIWGVFGPRVSPDFIVERPDQSRLHYSSFLLRDFDEGDEMQCGSILVRGAGSCSILGSHMYRASQAEEVMRLLASGELAMEQDDLEVVGFDGLPQLQQKMLDGTMAKPKGAVLVQADRPGRTVREYEDQYLGEALLRADPVAGTLMDVRLSNGVAILTITRPAALNALNEEVVAQLGAIVESLSGSGGIEGRQVEALVIRGAGRAFVAGADVEVFIGKTAAQIEKLANDNMAVFSQLERLPIPVISLVDGFALGGGNELAMSTAYTIVTENAQLGQPEVKLGIIPGYGGMQRLPRIIGPRAALEMAVNGEPVDGRAAVAVGLADEFHPSSTALARAHRVAREYVDGQRSLRPRDWDAVARRQRKEIGELSEDPAVASFRNVEPPAAADAGDLVAARRYAASIALRALTEGYEMRFGEALANDARLFGEVVTSGSGQEWSRRFLAKDPAQSSFLMQLPVAGAG